MTESFLHEVEKTGAAVTVDGKERPQVHPSTSENVAEVVKAAAAHRESLLITGGGTLPFTAVQAPVTVLEMTGLDSGLRFFPDDLIAECPAGFTYDHFMAEAVRLGFTVPAWGVAAPGQTCAGAWMSGPIGPWGAYHDELHRAVIGVTGADARGETVRFGGRTAKNVTGYDMVWFLGGTLGMFIAATSLIVKIQPAQDYRVISLSLPGTDACVSFLNRSMRSGLRVVRADLWAEHGLSQDITVNMAVEGMASIINGEIDNLGSIAGDCGASAIDSLTVDEWIDKRRRILSGLSLPRMVQATVPVSAAGGFIEQMHRIVPDMPVWGSPLQGRYFLVPAKDMTFEPVGEAIRSVGGKNPLQLSRFLEGDTSELFTSSEANIIASLKRELDPGNLFNPHLRIV